MKKFLFTLFLTCPICILLFIVIKIKNIDQNLIFEISKTITKDNSLKRKLIIDKRTSKRRIYFFVNSNSNIILYKREYRGFISDWMIVLQNWKYEKDSQLSFYHLKNDNRSEQPFFNLNNKSKTLLYYFDIFQYVKNQYFFIFLISLLLYTFIYGWLLDFYGGTSQHKIKIGFLLINFFICMIILFI